MNLLAKCAAVVVIISLWDSQTLGQAPQRFELIEPNGQVTATVQFRHSSLLISESTGQRFLFQREPRYDSIDGGFLSYYNQTLNRVIRLPRSGRGAMQTADFDDLTPRYQVMRRTIRPVVGPPGSPGIVAGGGLLGPVLGTGPRIVPDYGGGGPNALNYPYSAYRNGLRRFRQPQSVLLQSKTVPNPPLPPVTIQLASSGSRELRVAVNDLQSPSQTQKLKIAPRTSVPVKLQRDSGATLVQRFQVVTPLGDVVTRDITTPVPPAVRYEVVVHEWAMQSVAIDRTGRSANVIEDINFQGRGLGRFPLPAGDQLQAGTIDAYQVAKQSGNQGSVAPLIEPKTNAPDNVSNLERAIFEAQQRAVRKNGGR